MRRRAAGAFSLVRFSSAQGTAREIGIIFLSMALGLATGMGCLTFAALFSVIVLLAFFLLSRLLVSGGGKERQMKIVIPEDLDYTTVFTDLVADHTKKWALEKSKATNMGSLYELTYRVTLKDASAEKNNAGRNSLPQWKPDGFIVYCESGKGFFIDRFLAEMAGVRE